MENLYTGQLIGAKRIIGQEKPSKALIFLHGYGDNGTGLIGLSDSFASLFRSSCAFYSPNAPYPWEEVCEPNSYQWFSLRDYGYFSQSPTHDKNKLKNILEQFLEAAKASSAMLDDYIDNVIKEHNLKPSDIFLVGFSQGAFMAIYTGLQREESLGGIISFSGAPLIDKFSKMIKNDTPVLLNQGEQDEVVTPISASITAHTIAKANPNQARIKMVKRLNHGIDEESIHNARNFISELLNSHTKMGA